MSFSLLSSNKIKSCLLFMSVIGVLSASHAYADSQSDVKEALTFESGLWEIHTRPDFPGVPMAGSKADSTCLTVDGIKKGDFPLRISPFCSVKAGAWVGDKLELKIDCPGYPNVKGGGEAVLAGQTFTGKIVIPGGEGSPVPINTTFSYFYSGRKVAECPAKK